MDAFLSKIKAAVSKFKLYKDKYEKECEFSMPSGTLYERAVAVAKFYDTLQEIYEQIAKQGIIVYYEQYDLLQLFQVEDVTLSDLEAFKGNDHIFVLNVLFLYRDLFTPKFIEEFKLLIIQPVEVVIGKNPIQSTLDPVHEHIDVAMPTSDVKIHYNAPTKVPFINASGLNPQLIKSLDTVTVTRNVVSKLTTSRTPRALYTSRKISEIYAANDLENNAIMEKINKQGNEIGEGLIPDFSNRFKIEGPELIKWLYGLFIHNHGPVNLNSNAPEARAPHGITLQSVNALMYRVMLSNYKRERESIMRKDIIKDLRYEFVLLVNGISAKIYRTIMKTLVPGMSHVEYKKILDDAFTEFVIDI